MAGAAVKVKACGWLVVPTGTVPKLRRPGDNWTGAIPLPERLTTSGLDRVLSVIVIAPLRVPIVPGLKMTSIVQFCWGGDR